jgi:hypothetical protein
LNSLEFFAINGCRQFPIPHYIEHAWDLKYWQRARRIERRKDIPPKERKLNLAKSSARMMGTRVKRQIVVVALCGEREVNHFFMARPDGNCIPWVL